MLPCLRGGEPRAGVDSDESTVIDRDIVIYHTDDADADGDSPGSNRGPHADPTGRDNACHQQYNNTHQY